MRNRSLGPAAALASFSLAFTAAADSQLNSETAPPPTAPAAERPLPGMDEPMRAMDEPMPPAAEAAAPAPPTGTVARARFAMEVTDREPSDAVRRLTNDHDSIAFFTEQTITSPSPAVFRVKPRFRVVEPPSTLMHPTTRAPLLSATSSLLSA